LIALKIEKLFTLLDEYPDQVPINQLVVYLNVLELSLNDVQEHVKFSDTGYQRNLLHEGNGYQALILCWKNGQRSPIHNHKGSSCGVKILKGVATETIFELSPNNLIFPSNTDWLYEGDVTGSENDDIHQISNLQDEQRDLVTLHIYSPPLLHMDCYSLEKNEVVSFRDPIYNEGEGI